jgi:hypothetical protein
MTVRNLLLDQTTGDLVVVAGNLGLVSDQLAIEQAVNSNLRAFLGEWFLDDPVNPKLGVPYYQLVLVKNPDPNLLRSIFRAVIIGTVGVADATLTDLKYVQTAGTALRSLSMAWRGISDTGQFISGTPSFSTP